MSPSPHMNRYEKRGGLYDSSCFAPNVTFSPYGDPGRYCLLLPVACLHYWQPALPVIFLYYQKPWPFYCVGKLPLAGASAFQPFWMIRTLSLFKFGLDASIKIRLDLSGRYRGTLPKASAALRGNERVRINDLVNGDHHARKFGLKDDASTTPISGILAVIAPPARATKLSRSALPWPCPLATIK